MPDIGSVGLAWYKTGTVNLTQGSTAVTGVSTQWSIVGIKTGDIFSVDNITLYEIASVNSDTSLTLVVPFQGASGAVQNYAIIRNFAATMTAELAARVAALVNKYESYIDAELNTITGPKGDPGWTYKGTWATGRSYIAMDVVVYNNLLYVALLSHTSASANAPGTSAATWMSLGVSIQEATTSAAGLMSASDKAKMDKLMDPAAFLSDGIDVGVVSIPQTDTKLFTQTRLDTAPLVWSDNGSSTLGTMIIKIPINGSSTMLALELMVFNYNGRSNSNCKVSISGHARSAAQSDWTRTGVTVSNNEIVTKVRLARTGANYYILLNTVFETWSYPAIYLLFAGGSFSPGDMSKNWELSIVQTEPTFDSIITPPMNTGLQAETLNNVLTTTNGGVSRLASDYITVNGAITLPAGGTWVVYTDVPSMTLVAGGTSVGAAGQKGFAVKIA